MPVRVDLVDFAKVQQVVVEVEPLAHAPRADRLREVVDLLQPGALAVEIGVRGRDVDRPEIDVEDRDVADAAALTVAPAPAIDEVQVRIADALDRRNLQFADADPLALERPRPQLDRTLERTPGACHAQPDRAHAHPVLLRIASGE